ncbi:hypothetical protein, partial [Desulfovibrio sp.]|uniref:hypothetical protein n=1 Tax=Desulfovibrio sp. TaxID=885 RepID=UPI003AB789A1
MQDVDEHAEKKGISEKIPARAQKFLHVGAYPALVPPPWGRTPVGSVGTMEKLAGWSPGDGLQGALYARSPFLSRRQTNAKKTTRKNLRPQQNHGNK